MGSKYSPSGTAAQDRRAKLKAEFWPQVPAWLGPVETGYFCAPRTLPLVLRALRHKAVSGDKDPGSVYVDLLANHMGQGVVELSDEEDHAFAAGYTSVRSWRDRMKVLEDAGFLKPISPGNRRYGRVVLVHPSIAMKQLYEGGKLPQRVWDAYRSRRIVTKEASMSDLATREQEALPAAS